MIQLNLTCMQRLKCLLAFVLFLFIPTFAFCESRKIQVDWKKFVASTATKSSQGDAESMGILSILIQVHEFPGSTDNAIELAKKSAANSNPFGMYALARYNSKIAEPLDDRSQVSELYSRSFKMLKSQADKGHIFASVLVGDAYYYGRGIEKNLTEAVFWYRKFAGDTEGDIVEAIKQGKRARDDGTVGFARSLGRLSDLYYTGTGVEQSNVIAIELLRAAASQSSTGAYVALGNVYRNDQNRTRDYPDEDPRSWFFKAAEAGIAYAQAAMGDSHREGSSGDYGVTGKIIVEYYGKAAAQGDAYGLSKLAECYHDGIGVRKNLIECFRLMKSAAERGLVTAQYCLGTYYEDGVGVSKSTSGSVKWYQRAAGKGHTGAQIALGDIFKNGEDSLKNFREAVHWYRMAAEQGVVEAQRELADCYHHGRGVRKDTKEALIWYRKVADQGDSSVLDIIRDLSNSSPATNSPAVLGWTEYRSLILKKSEEGDPKSMGIHAFLLYFDSDFDDLLETHDNDSRGIAAQLASKSAASGDGFGMYSLAKCYKSGVGMKEDSEKATMLYARALSILEPMAKSGDPDAALVLADALRRRVLDAMDKGDGPSIDLRNSRSANWYKIAADGGNLIAQWCLGIFYSGATQHSGIKQNREEAVKWVQRAAESGLPAAQCCLGRLHMQGGALVRKSGEEAMKWLQKAAGQGNIEAVKMLEKLEDELDPEAATRRLAKRKADELNEVMSRTDDPGAGREGGPSTETVLKLIGPKSFIGRISIKRGNVLASVGAKGIPIGTKLFPVKVTAKFRSIISMDGSLVFHFWKDEFDEWACDDGKSVESR